MKTIEKILDTELIVAAYSPNQDEYREIVTAKGKPVARVFSENFGYNISQDEAKHYAKMMAASPLLTKALQNCVAELMHHPTASTDVIKQAIGALKKATNINTKTINA